MGFFPATLQLPISVCNDCSLGIAQRSYKLRAGNAGESRGGVQKEPGMLLCWQTGTGATKSEIWLLAALL